MPLSQPRVSSLPPFSMGQSSWHGFAFAPAEHCFCKAWSGLRLLRGGRSYDVFAAAAHHPAPFSMLHNFSQIACLQRQCCHHMWAIVCGQLERRDEKRFCKQLWNLLCWRDSPLFNNEGAQLCQVEVGVGFVLMTANLSSQSWTAVC